MSAIVFFVFKIKSGVFMKEDNQNKTETEQSGSERISAVKELILGEANGNAPKVTFIYGFSAIFNGLGIGLLLGVLLGLSVSPVVSGVIATISSLLAVLVGLNERLLDPLKSLRIGSFGLFSVAGILLGLYLRANDPFAPTLLDKMEEYRSIGYSDEEAREMITGFIRADSGKVIRQASVLYSGTIEANDCDYLRYSNSDTPPEEIIDAFKAADGFWKKLAAEIEKNMTKENQGTALLAVRDSFCNASQLDFEKTQLTFINIMNNSTTLVEIESKLKNSEPVLGNLVSQVQNRIMDFERLNVYRSLLNVFMS
ncbi:hypothetical protein SAMN00777080_3027 [Aquiflexum balticum DSM 16537]|uniref:Uncharacterized protein n=2 Tax=Aquiflexum TaxID=280472 RepID=A0A1W2H7D0_9BACT|nr:hypothetical protein SAMN00777080_3027 [Aquiflexum balticum DSM 16537]